jgi:hypothetical protein
MDGYIGNASSEGVEKPWWERNWVALVAGLALGLVLIIADDYGYGGLFEWTFVFVCGTTIAVAAFWERRTARWFAPAVALIIVVHVILLAARQWEMIPSRSTGTYLALKGTIAADFAVNALFLWILHQLFDPKVGIRAHWSSTAKAVTAVFVLFFLGLVAATTMLIVSAHDAKLKSARLVFSRATPTTMTGVMTCIDADAVENKQWRDVPSRYPAKRLFSQFWGRTYRVIDTGSARLLQVDTPNGRPLRPEEKQLVEKCAA